MRRPRLEGRSALVTGASRGIGRAVAVALAGSGARVVVSARSADALESLAEEIGGGAVALPADLGTPGRAEALAATTLDVLGGAPDILVNNAGAFVLASLEETSVATFAAMMQMNVTAPFSLAHHLVPAMRARGSGHLVTIGSVADRHPYPGNVAYAPSKYALRAMHEVLRDEVRGSGVRASLVSPGPVDTALWDEVDPDSREGFTPRSHMLAAEAVSEAVLWVVTQPATVNVDELRLSRA